MLELSELYVLTFNIGMFCPPKALPSGGWEAPGRWTGRVPSLCIVVTSKYFFVQIPRPPVPLYPVLSRTIRHKILQVGGGLLAQGLDSP
jgi:hypothetical protein